MTQLTPPPIQGRNDRVEAKQRAAEINRLRIEGRTYSEIAEHLGYADASGVRRLALAHASRLANESGAELRQIENDRLDACTFVLMEAIQDPDTPLGMLIRAADALVRVSARRAALNGLDIRISSHTMERARRTLSELERTLFEALGDPDAPRIVRGDAAD